MHITQYALIISNLPILPPINGHPGFYHHPKLSIAYVLSEYAFLRGLHYESVGRD